MPSWHEFFEATSEKCQGTYPQCKACFELEKDSGKSNFLFYALPT